MSKTLLLSNSLSKIKNAQRAMHKSVILKYSNLIFNTLKSLVENSFLDSVISVDVNRKKYIKAKLKYNRGIPVINGISILSKANNRNFSKYKERILGNSFETTIISTTKGIMSDVKASELKLGGEKIIKVF